MKKVELLKLFPSLLKNILEMLPEELTVCWYPSSGAGYNPEESWSGYNILDHWKKQPSKLKPNLFIFSDVDFFEIHPEAEVLFSNTFFQDPIIDFILSPVNFNLIPNDHAGKVNFKEFSNEIKLLFDLGLLQESNYFIGKDDDLLSTDSAIKKLTLDILINEGCLKLDSLIENQKNQEVLDIVNGNTEPIKSIILQKYLGNFVLMIQSPNEYVYSRFLDEKIQIPMLTINRPLDPFVTQNGIDIKVLGIKELIVGRNYVNSIILGDEFKKYPDFVFQRLRNTNAEDIANFYSRN